MAALTPILRIGVCGRFHFIVYQQVFISQEVLRDAINPSCFTIGYINLYVNEYIGILDNQSGRMSTKVIGVGVIALIIIAIAVYFLFISPSGSTGLLSGSNPLLSILSSKNQPTVSMVAGTIIKKFNQTQQLSVSYTGLATIGLRSTITGSITMAIPVVISFEKYANNTRVGINATGIPVLGNLSIISISLANGTAYNCQSGASLFGSSYGTGAGTTVQAKPGYTCTKTVQKSIVSSALNLSAQSQLNSTALNGTKVNFEGTKSYRGQQCYLVGVNGTINQSAQAAGSSVQSPFSAGSGAYKYSASACLSPSYYIPLNVTFSLSSSAQNASISSINFVMNETSLSGQTSLAQISALPGPVTNSSSAGNFSVGTTGITTPPPGSAKGITAYSGTLTCTPASSSFNCTVSPSLIQVSTNPVYKFNPNHNATSLPYTATNGTFVSFLLSQQTGNTWVDVNITYVPLGTPVINGVPQVSFNNSNVIQEISMLSGSSTMILNMQVSPYTTPGNYSGAVWARYLVSGRPGFQYTDMASLKVAVK